MKKIWTITLLLLITISYAEANSNDKIYSIGNRKVEYDLNGRIRKIGDEYVTYYKGYCVEIPKSKVFNPTQSDNYSSDPDFELILGAFDGPIYREAIYNSKHISKIGNKKIKHSFLTGNIIKIGNDKIMRNKENQIISIGDKTITRNENGLITKIGNDVVHRYKNGLISGVGNKKYFRNQDGGIFYISDAKYTQNKNGYVNSINSRKIDYNSDYSTAVSIENENGVQIYLNYIIKSPTDKNIYRY